MKRVLVCGSRTWSRYATVRQRIKRLESGTTVVHGACPTGADYFAEVAARLFDLPIERHPADWSRGKSAGPARNREMLDSGVDLVIAFRAEGESRGTDGTIAEARRRGIPVEVIT